MHRIVNRDAESNARNHQGAWVESQSESRHDEEDRTDRFWNAADCPIFSTRVRVDRWQLPRVSSSPLMGGGVVPLTVL